MSNSFNRSISKCISLLDSIEFLFQAGTFRSLGASTDFKKTAMRATKYTEVYNTGTKNQDFNLMLMDRSFFQFTETSKREDVRLAYYPNPYQFVEFKNEKKEALELLDLGEISFDESEQLLSEGDFTCDIPLIRYDLSLKQYCNKYHPAAHFHIGFYAENRWPVKRYLSPYAFLLKILKTYYPKIWIRHGDIGKEKENKLDAEYRNEVSNCAVISSDYFDQYAEQRLYFT